MSIALEQAVESDIKFYATSESIPCGFVPVALVHLESDNPDLKEAWSKMQAEAIELTTGQNVQAFVNHGGFVFPDGTVSIRMTALVKKP